MRLSGALPPGAGAWSLLAVDADLVGSPGRDLQVSFTVVNLFSLKRLQTGSASAIFTG